MFLNARGLFAGIASLFVLSLSVKTFAADFTEEDLTKMVNELDKVIPENKDYKYPIKCSIVNKDELNAYATLTKEGSDMRATMVVFTGLVKATGGDIHMIRAVVAHELSHLSCGHPLDVNPAARDLRNLWTRQQEFEADKVGANALVKAGYPRADMVNMLLFLDKQQGRRGNWLEKLTADHADPKARAAEVSENPAALKALLQFDIALAYEDARSHLYARRLFEASVGQWPELTDAYINAGKATLLFYYDNLPKAVRASWWRPDFGALITNPHAPAPQAVEVTDQDREAWKEASSAAQVAVEKNKGSVLAEELMALCQVLEPDAKKEVVEQGIDWFKSHALKEADQSTKLRYANNAGVGLQRIGDLAGGYHFIMDEQKTSDVFNSAIGENLGLVKVTGRSKDDDILAANVLFTWLSNTPPASPRYGTVKNTFEEICKSAGITAKEIKQKPAYLCQVVTMVTGSKEVGILLPWSNIKNFMGDPEKLTSFNENWPDLLEASWSGGQVSMWTDRNKVMRITSYKDGDYLQLKPTDPTSQYTLTVKVGMPKDELFAVLNEKASVQKPLAKGGKVETWNYYPDLNMGVLIEGDKIKAITVTPVVYEADE